MDLTKEEFADQFQQSLDTLLAAMAEEGEVGPRQFFSMVCILENLAFFSPVIYGALQKAKKK